jgi:GNAT superfamily N-acetyltransferase
MSSLPPLPDGVVLRPATDADLAAMADLMNAVEAPLGGDADSSADDVRHHWSRSSDMRTWLAELDGRLVGSLETFADPDSLNADVYVHPDLQRSQLGLTLLRSSEADARARGLTRVHNGIMSNDAPMTALLEREGYAPVRWFHRMMIDLAQPTPDAVWPEGFELAPFDLDSDGAPVHAAIEEGFADNWEHRPETYEEWHERTPLRAGYAPDLWIVVRDGGEVAAVTIIDAKRYGMGWIAAVAVRPAWRKRGLGLAMLHEAFRRLRDRGETTAGLGVDAQNPSGATRLYERAGMTRAWGATVYEKKLA